MSTFFRTFLPVIYVSPCENADQSKYRHQSHSEGKQYQSIFALLSILLKMIEKFSKRSQDDTGVVKSQSKTYLVKTVFCRSDRCLNLRSCSFNPRVILTSLARLTLEGVMLASDLFWTPDLILSVTVSLTYFIHEIRWIINTTNSRLLSKLSFPL